MERMVMRVAGEMQAEVVALRRRGAHGREAITAGRVTQWSRLLEKAEWTPLGTTLALYPRQGRLIHNCQVLNRRKVSRMPKNPKKEDSSVAIDLGISARASVEARVSTEIPAQSTGRLVDAITDIFRPFSKRQGLKADQIRLQREDVLIEIAKKA
jgi:hypothetical protein